MSEFVDRSLAASPGPWRWLIELRDHLLPDVDVIDADGRSLLPPVRSDVADRLRRLVRAPQPPRVAALLRDARPGTPMLFTQADGLRLGVMGIVDAARTRYALLLAERADAGRDTTRRAELARMASWLARALVSTSNHPLGDWREISVLHQVLQKAIARGAVEAVLSAYIEALAIWTDTDSRAYLGNDAGRLELAVSLAGANTHDAPRVLPEEAIDALTTTRRLSPTEARALGFSAERDTVLSALRIRDHAPWAIAYAGRISTTDEERLSLFEDMVRPALRAAAEVEASRLMWVMMQHLVDGPRSPGDAVARALAELERAGLCTAALVMLRDGHAPTLHVGVPLPEPATADSWPRYAVRHVPLDVPLPCQASLTLWRPANRPFTQRETRLASIGAAVLGRWLANALRRGDLMADVGATPALDRRRRLATSGDVSLLVILPEPTDTASDIRDTWVRDIRRQLRPDDIIGAVASGDLSVLLPATSHSEAEAVAARLTRLFAQHAPLALLDGAPIAIASVAGTVSRTVVP